MKITLFVIVAIIAMNLVSAFAQDWPQFLGPERNSTSPQKNVLRSWPETGPEVLWTVNVGKGYGTNERHDGLVCMSMDGEVMWKTGRDSDFNKGSMILADGLILATDGKRTLYLIEPDPSAFKPIASAELLNQGGVDTSNRMTNFGGSTQNWAPTALVDGKLLIRDQSRMMCVKVAK